MKSKRPAVTTSLAARYIDNDLVLSKTHAWTYIRLPLTPYEFLSVAEREALLQQITNALATLVTSTTEPVEIHLRSINRPFDEAEWAKKLDDRVQKWGSPAPVWAEYLDKMADQVWEHCFSIKEVYLGVCLGTRSATASSGTGQGVFQVLSGMFKGVERIAGFDDLAVPEKELAAWKRKAHDVHRAMSQSFLAGIPATSVEIARVIAHPLWANLEQPSPTACPRSEWGAGEITALGSGYVRNTRKYVEVEQIIGDGGARKGYVATLALSRFPDVYEYPAKDPWLSFIDSLNMDIEFSTRALLVPPQKVRSDVTKKVEAAKGQAEHILESGNSIPLQVREQIQVATELEYSIDKDRVPWVYARHRVIVTGDTPERLTDRVKTLIEAYKELGIDVQWPTGEQFNLLLESCPGDKVRSTPYFQRQELPMLAGSMATATAEVGDRALNGKGWVGSYIGYTTSRQMLPVFWSNHVAPARDQPSGVAILGQPGSGKTNLAQTLAYQAAASGVWSIYLDPKHDTKGLAMEEGLGNVKLFDLRYGHEGMLDPFSMSEDKNEAALLALDTLRLLLGHMSEEREQLMTSAVRRVVEHPRPSLAAVVKVLLEDQDPAARNLGGTLEMLSKMQFGRLCFAPAQGQVLRPEDGLTIVTLLGLDVPAASTPREDYSFKNRLAVAVMYLLVQYTRKLMFSLDKNHPKAVFIDEAWAITATKEGAKMVPEIARMGRAHNTGLVLVSQNAQDLMNEAVKNTMATKFAFRSTNDDEIAKVLQFLGLPEGQGYENAVRDLKTGECLMQDMDGRVSRVYIDTHKSLRPAFDTNPETRRKETQETGI